MAFFLNKKKSIECLFDASMCYRKPAETKCGINSSVLRYTFQEMWDKKISNSTFKFNKGIMFVKVKNVFRN